jgi:hypothetical protein
MPKLDRDLAEEAALRTTLRRAGYADPCCAGCDEHRIRRLAIPWKKGDPIRKHRVLCRNCLADKNHDPARDAEMRERFRLAGYPNPRCVACGEAHIWRLQLDHIAGEKHDGACSPLCGNCHADRSFLQRLELKGGENPLNVFEVIGRWLLGIAEWFELIRDKLYEFGEFLINLAKQGYGDELRFS